MFANMELAWETLEKNIKEKIKDKKAIHSSLGGAFFTDEYEAMESNGNHAEYTNEHPIVRTHPETGRQALYVNEGFTTRIKELSLTESDALLGFLFKHCARPEFHCRFRWRKNSMAWWDNRCVQHLAIWDYYPETRHGYRVTIEGGRPFYEPSQPLKQQVSE